MVARIVRILAEPRDGADPAEELNWLICGLGIVAAEQRWYCLMQLCLPLLADVPTGMREDIPDMDDDQLAQFLAFGHRINEALHLRIHGREAVADHLRQLRLPARRWNLPGTDRWVSMETVRDMLADIRERTRRLPQWARPVWAARTLRKRCSSLNARMLAATDMGLMRHMMATGIQWTRLIKPSQADAIHVRIHYASGILSVRLRSEGIARTDRTILPLAVGRMLSEEERPHIDRHFALSFLSTKVFETLTRLHKTTDIDPPLPYLQYFYGLLLGNLLSDPAVKERIAALGDHPTLVVTVHGALAQFPFAALHDGERYLAERFNVVQASPVFSGKDFQEGDIDYETLIGGNPLEARSLRVLADEVNLRHVEPELAELRALRDAGKLDVEFGPTGGGEPWSAETLRWLLASKGVALLSAHMRSSVTDAASAVVVTPEEGELPVSDMLSSQPQARLVMLSGCQSAGYTDWLAPGENSVVSLLRRAGVDSVVSTLWPVRDQAARYYNLAFVAALADGASRAVAHGSAQRAVMANITQVFDGGGERLARTGSKTADSEEVVSISPDHPRNWGGFILTGAWR